MKDWGNEPAGKPDPWLRLEVAALSVCVLASYAACLYYLLS